MTRNTLFPRSSFVGFDRLFDDILRDPYFQQETQGYPPHNVVQVDSENYRIEIALAGFTPEDLNIELQKGVLTVTGQQESAEQVEYIHKGISNRRFERKFRLHDHVVIDGASLNHGILSIALRMEVPEEHRPRKIPISNEPLRIVADTDNKVLLNEEKAVA